uniref:C-type lectin domain-containing protein n=1 Tax=Piliocolobus tephrosceles TaxID=591936 RepID=A0A8C9GAU2_9PRIM
MIATGSLCPATDQGFRGLQGLPGKLGPPGNTGAPGIPGPRGQKGDRGDNSGKGHTSAWWPGGPGPGELEGQLGEQDSASKKKKKRKKLFVTNGEGMPFSKVKNLCAGLQATVAAHKNTMTKDSAFLGITDEATKGQFIYVMGGRLTYSNWKKDEPHDHSSGEECVVLLKDRLWNDISCMSCFLAICEFPT